MTALLYVDARDLGEGEEDTDFLDEDTDVFGDDVNEVLDEDTDVFGDDVIDVLDEDTDVLGEENTEVLRDAEAGELVNENSDISGDVE
jgi:hypothetical protein